MDLSEGPTVNREDKFSLMSDLARAIARRDLADVDFLRIARIAGENVSHTELAAALGVPAPAVDRILSRAASVTPPRPSFSGATLREIMQRYAAQLISRDEVVDQLARWEYLPKRSVEEYDDLWEPESGTWLEVDAALHEGLIDSEVYEAARARREAQILN